MSAREDLVRDLCVNAANYIASIDGHDVAAYLLQRFGPALLQANWATLEEAASDDRPLLGKKKE
jgi:hypothetical protein